MANEDTSSEGFQPSSQLPAATVSAPIVPAESPPVPLESGAEGDDQEFGSFVEAGTIAAVDAFDPLSGSTESTAPSHAIAAEDPLDPLSSALPHSRASQVPESSKSSHNLIDEIMEYERNPSLLFNDNKGRPAPITTPTTSILDDSTMKTSEAPPQGPPPTLIGDAAPIHAPTTNTAVRIPSPLPPPSFDSSLDPLSAAQTLKTPEPGSGLTPAPLPQSPAIRSRTPVEPIAKGGGVAIEKSLGLIDQDYFTSREPAETIPIVSTPLASAGPSTPRPHSLPPRSPGWSLKSMISSQRPSPSHSREHTDEASPQVIKEESQHHAHHHHHHHHRQRSSPTLPLVQPAPPIVTPGLNRDLMDLDLSEEPSQDLPTPHPLDLPTPVPAPRSDNNQWPDIPEYSEDSKTGTSGQSYGTLSRIPSWIGSLLAGPSNEPEVSRGRPAPRGRRSSGSSSAPSFHSDRRNSNTKPLADVASPSPVSSPEPAVPVHSQSPSSFSKHSSAVTPPSAEYEPVHGQRGRPLPRARPSLEGIQQLYGPPSKSRSRSRPSDSPVARQREQVPVNITHSTPFAPPHSSSVSSLSTPYSGSLNVGFSPMMKTNVLPNTAGPSSSSNPFSTPTFTPIPGAPGFKPNDYDWDKGFSDELAQELRDEDPPAPAPRPSQVDEYAEDDPIPSGLGSIFGFGTFKRRSSDRDQEHSSSLPRFAPGPSQPYAYGHTRTATEPPQRTAGKGTSDTDRIMYATSRPIQKSNSRGSTVPPPTVSQLIEKKIGSIVLKDRKLSTEAVLNQELADLIRPHLPPLSRLPKTWTLLYSLDQHGISLNTLYNNCETPQRTRKPGQNYVGMGGVVLILRDSESSEQSVDGTFGAFIAEGLGRKSKGFFGGGDSFLWKYSNGAMQVFKASGRNTYFAICESGYMAFGGGSTSYGLYIDSGLLDGYSAPSLTFGNETLCNSTSGTTSSASGTKAEFECVGLEVWGVGPT